MPLQPLAGNETDSETIFTLSYFNVGTVFMSERGIHRRRRTDERPTTRMVAERNRLPDLSPVLHEQHRRRHRRPARRHRPARLSAIARSRRNLALANLPFANG